MWSSLLVPLGKLLGPRCARALAHRMHRRSVVGQSCCDAHGKPFNLEDRLFGGLCVHLGRLGPCTKWCPDCWWMWSRQRGCYFGVYV
eukprot:s2718_g6.t1